MYKLQVNIPKLNIRNTPFADPTFGNWVGEAHENDIVFAERIVDDLVQENSKWFKDTNNRFYWKNGLNILEGDDVVVPVIAREVDKKKSFGWFKALNIEAIWNTYNEKGEDAVVAVLDTGYDINNLDLPVPLLTKLFVNNIANNATIQDKISHGTFCTSVVASRNQSVNIGIAPLCKTLIGKVSLKGELQNLNIILDGIEWAIGSGADIISISLGLPLNDQLQIRQLQTRLDQITQNKNVLIFAACGDSDSGQIISKEFYPASLDTCISVGTVKDDQLHNITVRSNKTIIHTLGIDIEGYLLNNVIAQQSGTSMSVPIVAGVMALAVSFTKQKSGGQWNKNVLLQKLINTGSPIQGSPDKRMIDPLNFFQSL